jgi:hypothetical protein
MLHHSSEFIKATVPQYYDIQNYRKPRWGLAHISDFCMENSPELYIDKTQTAKVVLKSIWCSFCLKVQQRRAHDESQVRRRPIF